MFIRDSAREEYLVFWCKTCKFILAFFIVLGFLFGVYFAGNIGYIHAPLMRSSASLSVSIVNSVSTWLLPFTVIITVFLLKSYLIPLVAFVRSFTYGFCLQLICVTYGSAAWLIRSMFLFTGSVSFLILCWFCFRNLPARRSAFFKEAVICACMLIGVSTLDACIISPYLALLINC